MYDHLSAVAVRRVMIGIATVLALQGSGIAGTFYVSPDGTDGGPGTADRPWKSFAYAASVLEAGDTAIFRDGVYHETSYARIGHSGTATEPIIFKSQNPHGAVLRYQGQSNIPKIEMRGNKQYIQIRDFEMTQDQRGTVTSDIFIHCREGSNHCQFVGNKIYNGYEEAIKCYLVEGVLVDDNDISGFNHEGIDFVNVASSTVRNNRVSEVGRVGIMLKGGVRSIQAYNNVVRNTTESMTDGIELGGSSDANASYDSSGFEAYNCAAWNNVVIAEGTGEIEYGLAFRAATDCTFSNNLVIGADYGLYFGKGAGPSKGWTWDPIIRNPTYKNNIFLDAEEQAVLIQNLVENLDFEHNLYHNSPNPPAEPGVVYGDPQFVDPANENWHLQAGSPAIGAGVPVSQTGFYGEQFNLGIDRDGNARLIPWDIGLYEFAPLVGDLNADAVVDASDIDLLYDEIQAGSADFAPQFDLNNDGMLNQQDVTFLVEDILNTRYGDANLDGIVNESDLAFLADGWKLSLGADLYTWATGDFSGSGDIYEADLALLADNWKLGPPATALPEPSTCILLAMAGVIAKRRIAA
jgi:hypothetical protein